MGSLKSRLITVSTLWIALGIVAAGFVLSAVFRHHVTQQFYDELYVHLDELQRLAEFKDDSKALLQRNLSDPRYEVARSGYYWEIQRGPQVLARSASMQGAALKTPKDGKRGLVHTHIIEGPTGTLIVAEKSIQPDKSQLPVQFVIGTDQRHLNAVEASFNSTMAAALTVFGLSLVLAASLLIIYALRPLQQLRASLFDVRAGNAQKLSGDFPSEVVPLVDDLNRLLDSTAELIRRARTQAGNMAHGLKTPLAILTDEGYRLADRGDTQSSETVLAQCRKMQTHIDYQIARARAVAMRASPGVIARAEKAARDVAMALNRLYRDRNLQFEIGVPETLLFACDPADLNEMLANLVDNACKHARYKVSIGVVGEPVALVVEDDGLGLPPEAFDVVFNIGERWDSRVAGSGLGLAIVRDLAQLYGGDVKLERSKLGGLAVVLQLPAPI